MKQKPLSCKGCPLEHTGRGWAEPIGQDPIITFVGEALGRTEAEIGEPFVGQAGAMLNRAFGLSGIQRGDYRIGNIVSCQPPKDWLVGAPWEAGAIRHCMQHRDIHLHSLVPKVYVTLGVTATKVILDEVLHMQYSGNLNNWNGYVIGSGEGPFVVPTFHPAYILRGNQNLIGAFLFAIRRAMETASFGFTPIPADLIVDPDPEWFLNWAAYAIREESWVAVDIETPMKGENEEELEMPVGNIVRINFSSNVDQGITVPWDARYLAAIMTILAKPCTKVFWNARFDVPILQREGMVIHGTQLDAMWAWKMLQSNMPRGLGFVAPFYSTLPPWKHLNTSDPGQYAAMDAVQTLRVMFGIASDLQKNGQWEGFLRHMVRMDQEVIFPMEDMGLKLDQARLKAFNIELDQAASDLLEDIQTHVPEDLRPLIGDWKTPQPGAFPRTVQKLVYCCTDCGAVDVTPKHRCGK